MGANPGEDFHCGDLAMSADGCWMLDAGCWTLGAKTAGRRAEVRGSE